jgi:hypothetical protein
VEEVVKFKSKKELLNNNISRKKVLIVETYFGDKEVGAYYLTKHLLKKGYSPSFLIVGSLKDEFKDEERTLLNKLFLKVKKSNRIYHLGIKLDNFEDISNRLKIIKKIQKILPEYDAIIFPDNPSPRYKNGKDYASLYNIIENLLDNQKEYNLKIKHSWRYKIPGLKYDQPSYNANYIISKKPLKKNGVLKLSKKLKRYLKVLTLFEPTVREKYIKFYTSFFRDNEKEFSNRKRHY